MESMRQPAGCHVPRFHPAHVAHLDPAHARAGQQRREGDSDPAGAAHLYPQGAAGGQVREGVARCRGDEGEGREVGAQPVEDRLLRAQGVRGRAAARGVVEESGAGQPFHECVDMAVGQAHPASFLAQEGE